MSYTEKECIGCNRVLSLPPKTLCNRCRDAIRKFPTLRSQNDTQISVYKIVDCAPVPGVCYSGYNTAIPFGVALSNFLQAYGRVDAEDGDIRAEGFKARWRESCGYPQGSEALAVEKNLFYMASAQNSLFDLLMYRLADLIREAQQVGQEKGQNLLFQLNDGSLSLSDFNEKLSKAASRSKY